MHPNQTRLTHFYDAFARLDADAMAACYAPDAQFDEFSMQVKLSDSAGKYYFKVIQQCEKGRAEWTETAAPAGARLKFPAPLLEVVPAAGGAHQH